jgi:hypothetical protein
VDPKVKTTTMASIEAETNKNLVRSAALVFFLNIEVPYSTFSKQTSAAVSRTGSCEVYISIAVNAWHPARFNFPVSQVALDYTQRINP